MSKHDLTLEQYVWEVSMVGCDEEHGSVDEDGWWYGLMRDGSTVFVDHDPFVGKLEEQSREPLLTSAGLILATDTHGFKYVTLFDTNEALDAAWAEVVGGAA